MSILIENLSKKFVNFQALDHINLEIKTGSLVALVGPSGSGKSTLLRILAGLELPDSGRIWIDGKDVTYLPVEKRDIGFVFQNYSLFNTMNVSQNISFALDIRTVNSSLTLKRVNQLLNLIRLEIFSKHYPSQLSGGQKQRIALARSLAFNPKIFLLDEPFGALDIKVRKELRKWLCHFHEEVSLTTIFVTHDQQEALEIADELVIFKQGRIEQTGNPKEVYDNPANSFIKKNNSTNSFFL